jgi:hypothetical protein
MLSELVTKCEFECQENKNLFYKIGHLAAKTLVSLSAVYGHKALEKSAVCDWYNWFKSGQKSME